MKSFAAAKTSTTCFKESIRIRPFGAENITKYDCTFELFSEIVLSLHFNAM